MKKDKKNKKNAVMQNDMIVTEDVKTFLENNKKNIKDLIAPSGIDAS